MTQLIPSLSPFLGVDLSEIHDNLDHGWDYYETSDPDLAHIMFMLMRSRFQKAYVSQTRGGMFLVFAGKLTLLAWEMSCVTTAPDVFLEEPR